jgi:hypothetical protein
LPQPRPRLDHLIGEILLDPRDFGRCFGLLGCEASLLGGVGSSTLSFGGLSRLMGGRTALAHFNLAEQLARPLHCPIADALRAFVADRNERRNITAGQKAMAHAMLFPEPAKGGRGKKLSDFSDSLGVTKGHWRDLVSQARAVHKHAPQHH